MLAQEDDKYLPIAIILLISNDLLSISIGYDDIAFFCVSSI